MPYPTKLCPLFVLLFALGCDDDPLEGSDQPDPTCQELEGARFQSVEQRTCGLFEQTRPCRYTVSFVAVAGGLEFTFTESDTIDTRTVTCAQGELTLPGGDAPVGFYDGERLTWFSSEYERD